MKKVVILFLLLVCAFSCYSQPPLEDLNYDEISPLKRDSFTKFINNGGNEDYRGSLFEQIMFRKENWSVSLFSFASPHASFYICLSFGPNKHKLYSAYHLEQIVGGLIELFDKEQSFPNEVLEFVLETHKRELEGIKARDLGFPQ
jgi:hypothetical protein